MLNRKDQERGRVGRTLSAILNPDCILDPEGYFGPKLSGKTSAQLANAAGGPIMADTVAAAVR